MSTLALNLVQAQTPKSSYEALIWLGVMLVLTVAGGIFVMFVRRRLFGGGQDGIGEEGILDSLRRMRDQGEISQQEFESARRAMLEKAMSRKSPAKSAKPDADAGASRGPRGDLNK